MRILLGTDTYHPDVNGASYFTQRLAAGLIERGHAVLVACPSGRARSESDEHVGVRMYRFASVPVPRYRELRFSPPYPWRRARLLAVLKEFAPDLVHCQNHFFISRALIDCARELGIKVVATNHFVPENILVQLTFLPPGTRRAVGGWLGRDLARVYDRADAVAAPTPSAARLLQRTGVGKPVTPISCGLDPSRFGAGAPHPPAWLPRRPTMLFVGRLDREKRIEELIEGLRRVRERIDAQLVVVGRGKERSPLERHAKASGVSESVIFTGFVPDDDLSGLYQAADVFCMPGTIELQSIATLEAMAFAKPVVAVDALALPHLVRDGVNGYAYAAGDVSTLARRTGRLLSDAGLRERMGRASRKIATEHGIARTLDEYERFYANALGVPLRPALRPRPAELGSEPSLEPAAVAG